MARSLTIGILGFDGVEALDMFGPLECFAAARREGVRLYNTLVIGLDGPTFRSESGIAIGADVAAAECQALDTLVVPGGAGLREPDRLARAVHWLRERADRTRRVTSVCTGVYALAEAGLLDGRRAATHWRFAADVAARYPAVRIDPDVIFVRDGDLWTSAGITAGIDLALHLIELDHGRAAALSIARELVVYLKRPGGQAQFSDRLTFQTSADARLADVVAWMAGNVAGDLCLDALADRAGMSRRHFTRRFRAVFSQSAARMVEGMRLDEARQRLETCGDDIAAIARALGFASDDAFSRRFEKRFGLRPTTYRRRFAVDETAP